MKGRRGISPVIATVIIVAVTIAVAIAVAFWMTGIIGLFTGFEQLQITSIYDDSEGIKVAVKNTGTQTASIVDVYVNGRPCKDLEACTLKEQLPLSLKPGESTVLTIVNVKTEIVGQLGPGVSVEVRLLTASGKEYPKLIVLQQWRPQPPTQPPTPPPPEPSSDDSGSGGSNEDGGGG